jgi:hypothetical protein
MIKAGIVCGCLPTQTGIATGSLYPSLLSDRIYNDTGIHLEFSSIWYTRLSDCMNKVKELQHRDNPDLILFHVRPDPFLRLSKFLIRYRDRSGHLRFLVNLDATDATLLERDYSARNSLAHRERNLFKHLTRSFNYLAGIISGVQRRAILAEIKLIQELVHFCESQKKQLIIVGPASRPRSNVENTLLMQLERSLATHFATTGIPYISCFGTRGSNNESLFMADGVHVSRDGHIRMADLISPVVLQVIREIRTAVSVGL